MGVKRALLHSMWEDFRAENAHRDEFTQEEFHAFIESRLGRELTPAEKRSATIFLSIHLPRSRREKGKGRNGVCRVYFFFC